MNIEIGSLPLRVDLPGRAGRLQTQGSTAALVRELGDNYATYHAFLANRLVQLGGRPAPEEFRDGDDFYAAVAAVQDVVKAEAILRICRNYRLYGGSLQTSVDPSVPLVDNADRLVSVETGIA
jgi:hypothetical protein